MEKSYSFRIAAVVAVIAFLLTLLPAAPPATAGAGKAVPDKVIDQIASQFNRPPDQARAEMFANFTAQMEKAVALGQKAEKEYPDAPNLHVVRGSMLKAADFLASQKPDAASRKLLLDVSERIVASNAPQKAKISADHNVTLNKIRPVDGEPPPPKQAEKEIRAFAARYAGTDAAVEGAMLATILTRAAENKQLEDEFTKLLESRYVDRPGVRPLLKRLGRNPNIGKPFKADLSRLDGRKLALPDDLKGKVVVVDFWASWCGPCTSSMPEMKRLYEKYKAKGVEFVGISLDKNRGDLDRYLKAAKIPWIITYTGKGWNDPTVQQYGVNGIPSVWLVGKDGKIISDNARGKLDSLLEQAVK